jgi:hypothetical protein
MDLTTSLSLIVLLSMEIEGAVIIWIIGRRINAMMITAQNIITQKKSSLVFIVPVLP